ncbi:MAG: oxidoreductase [Nevskiales bacterium]
MSKWTLADIPPQNSRTIIVTGANSGIGYETAAALAAKGAHIIMACRNKEKAEAAAQKIRSRSQQGKITVMQLDVSSLESIRQFADEFTTRFKELHILINNAGIMGGPTIGHSKDGFELMFGTNHLGHFALTGLLFDRLSRTPGARVIPVTSMAHRNVAGLDLDDPNFKHSEYKIFEAYARSKLANLTFMYELNRRLRSTQLDMVTAAAHPGYTATNITSGANPDGNKLQAFAVRLGDILIAMPAKKGALPTLYAATEPDIMGGEYIGPRGLFQFYGHPKQVRPKSTALDPDAGARLWQISEELTGVSFLS